MKKIILSAIAVFAFGFSNAQDVKSEAKGIKFGAKAALNIANLTGDVQTPNPLIGFQVGGFSEFKLSSSFYIQPELMYSTQGCKQSRNEYTGSDVFSINLTRKLSYLNIPLMVKCYVTSNFNIEFGPQVGFLLSSKADADFTETYRGETTSGSTSVDLKDNTNSVDFGINIGLGYDITENISAGLRYNRGLSNISDFEDDDSNVNNSVFSISAGYKF